MLIETELAEKRRHRKLCSCCEKNKKSTHNIKTSHVHYIFAVAYTSGPQLQVIDWYRAADQLIPGHEIANFQLVVTPLTFWACNWSILPMEALLCT